MHVENLFGAEGGHAVAKWMQSSVKALLPLKEQLLPVTTQVIRLEQRWYMAIRRQR